MARSVPVVETPEALIAKNVAELRTQRRMTVRELSARLGQIGHPILPSGITKIENGQRRVDVADLVALAHALRVNPNRLLFPERAGTNAVALTPEVATTGHRAWGWADGTWPLDSQYDVETPQSERYDDFRRHVRPVDHRLRAEHPAARAARRLTSRVEALVFAATADQGAADLDMDESGTNPADAVDLAMARLKDELDVLSREASGTPGIGGGSGER